MNAFQINFHFITDGISECNERKRKMAEQNKKLSELEQHLKSRSPKNESLLAHLLKEA